MFRQSGLPKRGEKPRNARQVAAQCHEVGQRLAAGRGHRRGRRVQPAAGGLQEHERPDDRLGG